MKFGKLKPFFPDDYAVYDLETSGLDTEKDRILEIALLTVRKRKPYMEIGWILNPIYPFPYFKISPEITKITGLSHSEIDFGKDPKVAIKKFIDLLNQSHTIFTHNGIKFDHPFLVSECKRHDIKPPDIERYVDTAAIFKGWKLGKLGEVDSPFHKFAEGVLNIKSPGLKFNLLHCCNEFNIGTNDITAHRAMGDVKMTYRLIEAMREMFLEVESDV